MILIVLAAAGAGFYYYKYGTPESPSVEKIHHIQFKKITPPPGMKITLGADALVNNPNPFSVEITSIEADVFIDGKKANEIHQRVSKSMPANGKFDLPLEFDIPVEDKTLIKDLGSLVTGAWKKRSVVIKCEGKIFLKAAKLDVGIPFFYEKEHRLGDYF